MKLCLNKYLLAVSIIVGVISFKSNAQDFTLTVDHTSITDTVGSEMIFDFAAVNNSSSNLTLYIARTQNDLPADWQSSLCFEYCFSPMIDTIETTSQWGSSPLAPGDSAVFSVHVFALVNDGTGHLKIEVGDINNPSGAVTYDLTASTETGRFTLTLDHASIADTIGSEMIFDFAAVNNSSSNLTLYIARTQNDLPADWQSSLCFEYCFSPMIDTIETTSQWGSSPLAPGDSAVFSVHVFALVNSGTGNLTIEVGDANNPLDTISYNLTASAGPSAVGRSNQPVKYDLLQNYPNPFNPATTISYAIPHRSDVSLKVYNITGQEIAVLVNGVKDAGEYSVSFNAESLSSGIYFYKITAGQFTSVRKMILIK